MVFKIKNVIKLFLNRRIYPSGFRVFYLDGSMRINRRIF